MHKKSVLILSAVALAGCSNNAEQAEGVALKPGSWEVVLGTTQLDIPGLPEDELETARIDAGIGYPDVQDMCFEQSDLSGGVRSFISEIIIADLDCTETVSITGGSINGPIVCTPPGGGEDITMNLEGSYDAESFEMQIAGRHNDEKYPEGYSDTVMEFRGKRIEDCY